MYVSLKGTFIANASSILISDIGEGDEEALLCFTDLIQCCNSASGRLEGEWLFPDGSPVQVSLKEREATFIVTEILMLCI